MKCTAIFSSIHSISAPTEVIQRLSKISLVDTSGLFYRAEVPYPSQHHDDILSILDSSGMSVAPRGTRRDRSIHYVYVIHRKYSSEDFLQSEFLRLRPLGQSTLPQDRFGLHIANQNDLGGHGVKLVGKKLLKKYDTILAPREIYYPDWALVPDQLQDVLKRGGFSGLVFDPTSVVEGDREQHTDPLDWEDYPDRWWRLNSNKVLPKLAPYVELVSTNGKPYKDDFSQGCGVIEPPYGQPELHYQRSDLDAFGLFDVAKTHECFGGPLQKDGQALIVSQRFYRYCVDNDIKCDWRPVRIDEE